MSEAFVDQARPGGPRPAWAPRAGEVPGDPGVYRFRDKDGRVIYVGKAKSLRSRLSSYFQDVSALHQRTATMVRTAASVEWTVVATEVEALQLEYSWIKEFDPRFNVRYRDDKSYPFLAVTLTDEFPRAQVMRGEKRKGTRYFGPYSHAWAIRETLDLLLRVFPMRTCSTGVFKRAGQSGRPCLLGYIDKCSAPCVGRVSEQEHRAIAEEFCDFMAGNTSKFVRRTEKAMRDASAAQDYERAAQLRDDLQALTRALEKNAVVLADGTDADVYAIADDELEAAVQVFHVRGGRVRGQRGWVVETESEDLPSLVEHLLQQVYGDRPADAVPREVLVPVLPADPDSMAAWLSSHRGAGVAIRVPQRGDKRALMDTVRRNAEQSLNRHKLTRAGDLTARSQALAQLQEALALPDAPLRIECYDVSHVQGAQVVASMVVFEDGLARKSEYRRFVIRGAANAPDEQGMPGDAPPPGEDAARQVDDTAAMREVLTRRFRRLLDAADGFGRSHGRRVRRRHRTGHRPPAKLRLPSQPRRGRRGAAAGPGGGVGAHRPGHRRRERPGAGQAPGGGLAAGRRLPGDPAAHQRGALPAAAGPRRGAPLRDHLPSPAPVEGDDNLGARRHTRAGRHAAQGVAREVRLGEAATGGNRATAGAGGRDRAGPGPDHPRRAGHRVVPAGAQR